ncbi:MAG: hypothetical protein GY792_04025, partial [Gammaproteobacteria bacterium]|nr:hypothetical protein [Gammaproteobacteria bacterium]
MPENKYVEMICHLAEQPKTEAPPPEGFEVRPLSTADDDSLYSCYYAAFKAGDARFFFDQGEAEKRAYFDTLGLAEARNEPGSTLILKDSAIVGFTYVIPYREANRHISCMVVHP